MNKFIALFFAVFLLLAPIFAGNSNDVEKKPKKKKINITIDDINTANRVDVLMRYFYLLYKKNATSLVKTDRDKIKKIKEKLKELKASVNDIRIVNNYLIKYSPVPVDKTSKKNLEPNIVNCLLEFNIESALSEMANTSNLSFKEKKAYTNSIMSAWFNYKVFINYPIKKPRQQLLKFKKKCKLFNFNASIKNCIDNLDSIKIKVDEIELDYTKKFSDAIKQIDDLVNHLKKVNSVKNSYYGDKLKNVYTQKVSCIVKIFFNKFLTYTEKKLEKDPQKIKHIKEQIDKINGF